jgi:hypothetical protein
MEVCGDGATQYRETEKFIALFRSKRGQCLLSFGLLISYFNFLYSVCGACAVA